MNLLLRTLTRRASLLLFLTIAMSLVAAVLFGELKPTVVFLILLASALQVILSLYKRVYSALIPFEKMKSSLNDAYPQYLDKIAILLVLTPVLGMISVWLGWIWIAAGYLSSSRELWTLAIRYIERKKQLADNKASYTADAPQVIAYISGLSNVAYQINQWLPVLEGMEKRVAIIVRERSVYEGMTKTQIPVYFARTQFDVEFALAETSSVKTVLYPANTMKNVQALRHFRLSHFFINHGESDKAVNQSKLLMAYDKLLVGGPLAERRLREAGLPLRQGQIEYVGRPQAEVLLDVISGESEIRTVLYAPTWEGFVEDVNYSSVCELGYKMLEKLSSDDKLSIMFKSHPYTGERNKKNREWLKKIELLCAERNIVVIDKMTSIHEVMNKCDLLITDISSVLNEFLVTNKPIILCNVKGSDEETLAREFPSSRAAYTLTDGEAVGELINAILHEDWLSEERKKVRRDSLSEFPEGAMIRFKNLVEKSVDDAA